MSPCRTPLPKLEFVMLTGERIFQMIYFKEDNHSLGGSEVEILRFASVLFKPTDGKALNGKFEDLNGRRSRVNGGRHHHHHHQRVVLSCLWERITPHLRSFYSSPRPPGLFGKSLVKLQVCSLLLLGIFWSGEMGPNKLGLLTE